MKDSNLVATILALLVILWTIISMRVRETDTSPAILHNAVWAGGLMIVGSGLMRYAPMSGYAWLLIASSIFFFNSGVVIGGARPKYRGANLAPIVKSRFLVTRRMYRTLLLGFSVGFAVYLATIARLFGLSTLIRDPLRIRGYSDVSYLEAFPLYGKILFYLGPLCLILTIFPEFVQGLRGRPFIWRLAIMTYLAGAQVATLQRTNLFFSLTWVAGILVLRLQQPNSEGQPGRLNSKRIFSLIAVAAVGLTGFQGIAVALGKTGTQNLVMRSAVDPRIRNNSAVGVLYYASSGIPAFGSLTDSQNEEWPPSPSRGPVYGDYNPQTWGAATFVGPLKLIPGVPHWNELAAFIYLPVPTNVYTWLEPWYRDLRWAGVLFGSIITGIVIGRFARRRDHSPEAMLAASLLVGFSALATFTNPYMTVMSVVTYVALWFVGALRRSREIPELKRNVGYISETRPVIRHVRGESL